MIQTVEAVVDAAGRFQLLGEVQVAEPRRALVTVLDEPGAVPGEAAMLAEAAIAVDRSRPEEDAAWSHQSRRSHLGFVSVLGPLALESPAGRLPG
ncbi:MAG: hypothetical protein ACYC3I_16215 [Gemmataceae bacterium]